MKKTEMERSIKRAVKQLPTVDFEKMASTPVYKMSAHDHITRQPEKKKIRYMKRFSAAFACCVVMLVCFAGWFNQYGMPDSVIALDVNPSIEIVTNKHDQILTINALNEDAKSIVKGLDFNKHDLKSTVDTLIASLISHGYLNAEKNVIMISVENKDIRKADKLAAAVDRMVQDSSLSRKVSPQIVNQTFKKDETASALAKQYNVSVGKIKLINRIRSTDASVPMQTMTQMPVKDLLSFSQDKKADLQKTVRARENFTSPPAISGDSADSSSELTDDNNSNQEKDQARPFNANKDNQKQKNKN